MADFLLGELIVTMLFSLLFAGGITYLVISLIQKLVRRRSPSPSASSVDTINMAATVDAHTDAANTNTNSATTTATATTSVTINADSSKLVITLSVVGMVLYWLASILFFAAIFLALVLDEVDTESHPIFARLGFSGGGVFYLLGQWMILWIFVVRIDFSFRTLYGGVLQYHRYVLRFLYACIVVLLGCMVALVMPIQDEIKFMIFGIYFVLYLCLCILLVFLFLRKIFSVMKMKASLNLDLNANGVENANANTNTNNDNDSEIENKKETRDSESNSNSPVTVIRFETVADVTRFALLVSIAIASSTLTTILVFMIGGLLDVWPPVLTLLVMDCFANVFCLYFMFGYNRALYFVLCSSMHNCCQKCCVDCVTQHLRKQDGRRNNKDNSQREAIDYASLILK